MDSEISWLWSAYWQNAKGVRGTSVIKGVNSGQRSGVMHSLEMRLVFAAPHWTVCSNNNHNSNKKNKLFLTRLSETNNCWSRLFHKLLLKLLTREFLQATTLSLWMLTQLWNVSFNHQLLGKWGNCNRVKGSLDLSSVFSEKSFLWIVVRVTTHSVSSVYWQ